MIYGGLGLGFSASGLGGCDSGRRLLGFFFLPSGGGLWLGVSGLGRAPVLGFRAQRRSVCRFRVEGLGRGGTECRIATNGSSTLGAS